MDVHPVDVLVARSDGSTATPRLLGFMDIATGRVWCELVFLDKRGRVRNVDLIEAFAAMAMHPAWACRRRSTSIMAKNTSFRISWTMRSSSRCPA